MHLSLADKQRVATFIAYTSRVSIASHVFPTHLSLSHGDDDLLHHDSLSCFLTKVDADARAWRRLREVCQSHREGDAWPPQRWHTTSDVERFKWCPREQIAMK